MPKYRVWAMVTSYCYVDVLAEDEYKAEEIAELIDGGDFTPCEDMGGFEIIPEQTEIIKE